MIRSRLVLVFALALTASSCTSGGGQAFEDEWEMRYRHSIDFLWQQCIESLEEQYAIAEADETTRTITTDWDVHLGVFSEKGYRTRLIVGLEGDVTDGYKVSVKEELEVNQEATNPEALSEADWSAGEADGGSASKFRIAMHRRLNPSQEWRDVEQR